ncbi:MAG TPA: hypothetical protein ENF30_03095 [Candidatus Desulfofervidus auxilii]|uniref:Uncharacterized protein n=1 Tax=Desulfofervidus auxilii TaxID=1621989 RepID=A0A7V0IAN0_DESA2|nr:hypothetical protein [Candidatus Desulfofervidus auxilii]
MAENAETDEQSFIHDLYRSVIIVPDSFDPDVHVLLAQKIVDRYATLEKSKEIVVHEYSPHEEKITHYRVIKHKHLFSSVDHLNIKPDMPEGFQEIPANAMNIYFNRATREIVQIEGVTYNSCVLRSWLLNSLLIIPEKRVVWKKSR